MKYVVEVANKSRYFNSSTGPALVILSACLCYFLRVLVNNEKLKVIFFMFKYVITVILYKLTN